jgi:hypothetical protein
MKIDCQCVKKELFLKASPFLSFKFLWDYLPIRRNETFIEITFNLHSKFKHQIVLSFHLATVASRDGIIHIFKWPRKTLLLFPVSTDRSRKLRFTSASLKVLKNRSNRMHKRSKLIVGVILILTMLPLVVLFQNFTPVVTVGSESKMFVPLNYSPLSGFQEKMTATRETLVFTVSPRILNYIKNGSYVPRVAVQNISGTVILAALSSVDHAGGRATLITSTPGKYVFVSAPFTNDFPIVTHWKQSLNAGRGGFQAGASDAIGTLDYSPSVNLIGETTDIFDTDPASPFTFNIKKYALFSSDPINPNANVPSIDRYVGENYAVDKITDRLAVYQSLKALETTGYPLLHRNHPWAFDTTQSVQKRVLQNLPAFQVVHATVVEAEVGKSSLATYVLPPNWVSKPATPYPVLFNGHYDIHQNFVWGHGQDFILIMSHLLSSGSGPTVGIIWNGGGAYGSQTMQLSAYHNAAYLFHLAQFYVGADLQRIVTAGISRGAQTALNVAANPIFDNYKVSYALAWSLPSIMGEHAIQWASTTYPGDMINLAWTTGYKYSYQESFVDPNTGLKGLPLFLKNAAGSEDPGFADQLSPIGDWSLESMKSKGTSVYLSIGTNDGYLPFNNQLRVYQKMQQLGIPAQMDIGFRIGHSFFTDRNQLVANAMKEVIAKTFKPFSGIKYYQKPASGSGAAVEVNPGPFFFAEIPKQVYLGQKLRLDSAGTKGLAYSLFYYKIDDDLWKTQRQIRTIGDYTILRSNIFSSTESVQSIPIDVEVPQDMLPGNYICLAVISNDNGQTWNVVDMYKNSDPRDGGLTIFEVLTKEQTLPGPDLGSSLMKNGTGSGISTH